MGHIVWNSPWDYGDRIDSTPAIDDDGRIYFGVNSEGFYILFSNGAQDWYFPTSSQFWSCPVIVNDGNFSFNNMSRLWYFQWNSNGPALTSWPMYRANARRTGRVQFFLFNSEALKFLISNLKRFVPNNRLYNSLYVKLASALKSYEKGQTNSATNKIEAFINEVQAQRGKKIGDENGRLLIDLATGVIY
jgi:hypothetical protein